MQMYKYYTKPVEQLRTIVLLWESQFRGALICFLASELIAVLGKTVHESSMAQKELAIFYPHESIKTILTTCRVMTEFCSREFNPIAICSTYPLIAVSCFSQ